MSMDFGNGYLLVWHVLIRKRNGKDRKLPSRVFGLQCLAFILSFPVHFSDVFSFLFRAGLCIHDCSVLLTI